LGTGRFLTLIAFSVLLLYDPEWRSGAHMNWALEIPVLLCLGLGIGIWWLVRRIVSPDAHLPVTAAWIEELSPDRYGPMLRLLDQQDLAFLRRQPGFTPRMVSRLRAQRSQVFRGYLRSLNYDFARVVMALKLVLMHAHKDRPELAAALVRQQILFAAGIATAHARLLLYRWGWCSVDVTGLMRIFDAVRLELQSLVPAAVGVEA
jgi:hypothetical protein